jgi:predicted ABC-type transport system involved in lysophospholipase L1 biosynthesis ATPase subunit
MNFALNRTPHIPQFPQGMDRLDRLDRLERFAARTNASEAAFAATPTQPVLKLSEVGMGEISLSVCAYAGEIVHLGGGTPAARLRVLAMAAGFGPCGSGRCEVLGHDLLELNEAQQRLLRDRHVARVFAGDHLSEAATVQAAVALPLVRLGMPLADARARAELELDTLGCVALADLRPEALGPAEAHMALMARAMALRPRLLVLEQPETGLAPTEVSAVRLGLWSLASAFGTCVLMSSSHPRLLATADRYIDLDRKPLG